MVDGYVLRYTERMAVHAKSSITYVLIIVGFMAILSLLALKSLGSQQATAIDAYEAAEYEER